MLFSRITKTFSNTFKKEIKKHSIILNQESNDNNHLESSNSGACTKNPVSLQILQDQINQKHLVTPKSSLNENKNAEYLGKNTVSNNNAWQTFADISSTHAQRGTFEDL